VTHLVTLLYLENVLGLAVRQWPHGEQGGEFWRMLPPARQTHEFQRIDAKQFGSQAEVSVLVTHRTSGMMHPGVARNHKSWRMHRAEVLLGDFVSSFLSALPPDHQLPDRARWWGLLEPLVSI
jgi:hypothetical protein